jgi:hypothetical protein
MADNRLVPYSVHLKRDVYDKLKLAAGQRKASGLVRDAITLIIEGDDQFNGGYNKGVRDSIALINEDDWASKISLEGTTIAEILEFKLTEMIVNQNINKESKNGKAKG